MATGTPTRVPAATWSDIWDDAGDTTATDFDTAYATSTSYYDRWHGREFTVDGGDTHAVDGFLRCPDHPTAGTDGPVCACLLPLMPRYSRGDLGDPIEINGPGPWRIVDYSEGGGWDDEGGVMYPEWDVEPVGETPELFVDVWHYNEDGSPDHQIRTPLDPKFIANAWVTPPGFGRPA